MLGYSFPLKHLELRGRRRQITSALKTLLWCFRAWIWRNSFLLWRNDVPQTPTPTQAELWHQSSLFLHYFTFLCLGSPSTVGLNRDIGVITQALPLSSHSKPLLCQPHCLLTRTTVIGFRAQPNPVLPHLNLMNFAKIRSPNEATFTDTGGQDFNMAFEGTQFNSQPLVTEKI